MGASDSRSVPVLGPAGAGQAGQATHSRSLQQASALLSWRLPSPCVTGVLWDFRAHCTFEQISRGRFSGRFFLVQQPLPPDPPAALLTPGPAAASRTK